MEIVKTANAAAEGDENELVGQVNESGKDTVFSVTKKGEEYQPESRQKQREQVFEKVAKVEDEKNEDGTLKTPEQKAAKVKEDKNAKPTEWQTKWKEHFAEYENEEVLKSSLTEYKTKAEKAAELETKYAELEAKSKLSPELQRVKDVMETLAKEGKVFGEREFAQLNKDYSKIKDSRKLVEEGLRDKNPDWTDAEIELHLEREYLLGEWDTEKDELGQDIPDTKNKVQKAMEAKIDRDAETERARLTEKQKSLFIKVTPNEEEEKAKILAQTTAKENRIKGIEARAKEISIKKSKLSFEFNDDEIKQMTGGKGKVPALEFEPTEAERESAINMFKRFANSAPIEQWQPFLDKDGEFTETSDEQAYQTFLNGIVSERAIKGTAVNQFQKGREYEIKNNKKADAFNRREDQPGDRSKKTKSYLQIR
jgi:hypothetical protein